MRRAFSVDPRDGLPVVSLAILLALQALHLLSPAPVMPAWYPVLGLPLAAFIAWRVWLGKTSHPIRGLALAGTALSGTLALLSLGEAFWESTIHARWSEQGPQRLSQRSDGIQAEFRRFLEDLSAPPPGWKAGLLPSDRESRFAGLRERVDHHRDPDRFGWTLWSGSDPDAWAGQTTPVPPGEATPGRPGYRIARRGAALVLIASARLFGEWSLEGEYLLQSPLEDHPRLPLPSIEGAGFRERTRLVAVESAGPNLPPASDTIPPRPGTPPRELDRFLDLDLASTGQGVLIRARLEDERDESVRRRVTGRLRAIGAALIAMGALGAALVLFRRACRNAADSSFGWFAGATFLLWAARIAALPVHRGFPGSALWGFERFGCDLAGPLFRSPLDLLLSASTLALQAGWLEIFMRQGIASPRARRGFAAALLPPALLLARFIARFVGEAPRDARFDLLRMEFIPPDPGALLVQAGIFLLAAAVLRLFLTTGWALLAPAQADRTPGPRRFPEVARKFAFAAAVVLLYLPLVARASHRQREIFFERQLLPRVEGQNAQRRQLLETVLDQVARSAAYPELDDDSPPGRGDGAAYRLWADTSLNEEGLSSSLRLLDPDGHLLGRFGLNLPTSLEGGLAPRSDVPRIRALLGTVGGTRRRILEGSVRIRTPRGRELVVQVDLLDEYENLTFIRADNIYVQLFRRTRTQQTNPELLGSEPLVAVFDWSGRLVYSNVEAGPSLPAPIRRPIRPMEEAGRWRNLELGDDRYRALIKPEPDRTFALGFLAASPLESAGTYARHSLLGLFLWTGMAAPLGLVAPPPARRRRGFFRRLLLLVLTAALVPLLALALFLVRFAARAADDELVSQGLASVASASRIIEDYLSGRSPGEEAPVGDDVAYWLSRVVRQDLDLYQGERILATSTRELFSSGLLSGRLDGRTFEDLWLRHRAFALSQQRLGEFDYLTIAVPVSLGDGGRGILAVPLAAKQREILRQRADINEAVLIATVAMVLLVTVLAHYLARRISEPITALARGARLIEEGNYDAEVQVRARDEPALLVDSFNRMAASLRRQREDLRRRRDYMEKILLNATTGVISTDAAGRVVTLNPAARLLLGLAAPEPDGRNLFDLLGDGEALRPLREALERSRPEREGAWTLELPEDGRSRNLRVVSLPFRETAESPAGRILLLEDLTETVRSSRLEAWAEMARRIAHEIKNPLTPIQLSADHLRRVHRAGDPRRDAILEECLNTIQNQVTSLRRIAADFSDYARLPELRPRRVDPAGLLEQALAPYRGAPPPGVSLHAEVAPGTPDLQVDPETTRRSLVNLIQNALEAMPDGGELRLIAEPGDTPGRVRIRVRDTGAGMDEKTRARLFEPYFSTKGAGTGLGMSIVKRTTEEQGGRVEVRSAPGAGTEVALEFPAAPPEPDNPGAAPGPVL